MEAGGSCSQPASQPASLRERPDFLPNVKPPALRQKPSPVPCLLFSASFCCFVDYTAVQVCVCCVCVCLQPHQQLTVSQSHSLTQSHYPYVKLPPPLVAPLPPLHFLRSSSAMTHNFAEYVTLETSMASMQLSVRRCLTK